MSGASWLDWAELHDDHNPGHADDCGFPRSLRESDLAQCGTCERVWCITCHPTPAARCPFEYDHEDEPAPAVFRFMVTIEAETEAQALQVMAERMGYDEPIHEDADGNEYPEAGGFDYSVDWESYR